MCPTVPARLGDGRDVMGREGAREGDRGGGEVEDGTPLQPFFFVAWSSSRRPLGGSRYVVRCMSRRRVWAMSTMRRDTDCSYSHNSRDDPQ